MLEAFLVLCAVLPVFFLVPAALAFVIITAGNTTKGDHRD